MSKGFSQRGFTLVEVMVAVAVIGILAAIALPSYTRYVADTHRANAKAILAETAQYLERYFTTNNTYAGASVSSAVAPKNAAAADARYRISFSVQPDATGYTLQAVPAGHQAGDRCGTLTLSGSGAQGAAGAGCW